MDEAIAFDIAGELITKLMSCDPSQIGVWWNFKDDLDDFKRTLSTVKAVLLGAEEKSMTNNLIKVWLEELTDALYDADDLLDDFSTEALRKDLMSGNKLTKEVRLFFLSSNQFAYSLKMGRKIKAINARLALIGSEAHRFGLVKRDCPVETSFMTKIRQQTHSFMCEDNIIGRDYDKLALLKLVLGFQSEENLYIIPIVGIGGLGKTTLARLVYNDEMVRLHFELMMWVAKISSNCLPYVLKGLSDDDAWSLFKEITFMERYADPTNSAFVEIGKHILKKCAGVPLAIKTIGGMYL
ncbi:disease resistance protein RGA2-like isoform X1 [Gossypium australe]|uniref:Disease resistance protein RGA2-like isoform X1 n=1 Tax=Gossypium australe TaxID=47621 RepID=A0A5B6VS71_9ROSI|nr:disease resistance protein RGA2-like isoform X1 [Gossypium australe]